MRSRNMRRATVICIFTNKNTREHTYMFTYAYTWSHVASHVHNQTLTRNSVTSGTLTHTLDSNCLIHILVRCMHAPTHSHTYI